MNATPLQPVIARVGQMPALLGISPSTFRAVRGAGCPYVLIPGTQHKIGFVVADVVQWVKEHPINQQEPEY